MAKGEQRSSMGLGHLPVAALFSIWPVLTNLPTFLGALPSRYIFVAALYLTTGFLVARWLFVPHASPRYSQILWAVLIGWICFVMWRGSQLPVSSAGQSISQILLGIGLVVSLELLRDLDEEKALLPFYAVVWAIPIYVFLNILLLDGNISSLYGNILSGRRIYFLPTITGSNSIAALNGVALISMVFLWRKFHKVRPLLFIMIASSVLLALATGSRGTMIYASISIAAVIFMSVRTLRMTSKWLVFFWLVSAPLLLLVFASADALGLGELFLRDGGERLGFGTGRGLLWSGAIASLWQDASWQHVFGAGYGSSAFANVESVFYFIFDPNDYIGPNALLPSLHNVPLQIVYDVGYVGLALITCTILYSIQATKGRTSEQARFVLTMTCYYLMSGFTEPFGSIYNIESFIYFLVVLGLGLNLYFHKTKRGVLAAAAN